MSNVSSLFLLALLVEARRATRLRIIHLLVTGSCDMHVLDTSFSNITRRRHYPGHSLPKKFEPLGHLPQQFCSTVRCDERHGYNNIDPPSVEFRVLSL